MDEDEPITIIPREELDRLGNEAIRTLAGGVLLFLMAMGVRFRIPGIALSMGALLAGLACLFARDGRDRKPSIIMTIAGVLGMFVQFGIPLLRPFAVFILGLGGILLFISGIWKGIVYLSKLQGRH